MGSGTIFVCDYSRVRAVTPTGVVSSLAGLRQDLYVAETSHADGIGSHAHFTNLFGIGADANGHIVVTDGFRIRKITPLGSVVTLAGTQQSGYVGTWMERVQTHFLSALSVYVSTQTGKSM